MHVHASAFDFMVFAAYLIIFGFLWRTLSIKLADRKVGQAMAFVF